MKEGGKNDRIITAAEVERKVNVRRKRSGKGHLEKERRTVEKEDKVRGGAVERCAYQNGEGERFYSEKAVCSLCKEEIDSEIYTDRFHEYLCLRCLIRVHRA